MAKKIVPGLDFSSIYMSRVKKERGCDTLRVYDTRRVEREICNQHRPSDQSCRRKIDRYHLRTFDVASEFLL